MNNTVELGYLAIFGVQIAGDREISGRDYRAFPPENLKKKSLKIG